MTGLPSQIDHVLFNISSVAIENMTMMTMWHNSIPTMVSLAIKVNQWFCDFELPLPMLNKSIASFVRNEMRSGFYFLVH